MSGSLQVDSRTTPGEANPPQDGGEPAFAVARQRRLINYETERSSSEREISEREKESDAENLIKEEKKRKRESIAVFSAHRESYGTRPASEDITAPMALGGNQFQAPHEDVISGGESEPEKAGFRRSAIPDSETDGRYSSDFGHEVSRKPPPLELATPTAPHSSYYMGPPPIDSAFGSDPVGEIGVHFPREIVRVERDFTVGDLVQFYPTFPLELEGRITPTQFQETINSINEILVSAYSIKWSFFDNLIGALSLYVVRLLLSTHYDREMRRMSKLIDSLNAELYNPRGLNIVWPRKSAFMFLEIEYY